MAFEAGAGTVVVHERSGEDMDDGSESVHHENWTHYRLAAGVFIEVTAR